MMIQWLISQPLAGRVNTPVKIAPACRAIVSPQVALFRAACRFPLAGTAIVLPGAGVSAIALATVTRGSSAGPPKLPVAVLLAASVTLTVKLNVPTVVGMPPKSPFVFIVIPAGGVPAEMLQL